MKPYCLSVLYVISLVIPASFALASSTDSLEPISTTCTSFDADNLQTILDKRTFQSKEELLQLFYLLYQEHCPQNIQLQKEAIEKLGTRLTSLFPLEACSEMSLTGDLLEIDFNDDQEVTVPGTLRQATLHLSKRIVFIIENDKSLKNTLAFKLVLGSVNLELSWLARRFISIPDEIRGTRILYLSDDDKKESTITLEQVRHVPKRAISITKTAQRIEADVNLPEYPAVVDLEASVNQLLLFGIIIDLVAADLVQYNKGKPIQHAAAYNHFKQMIEQVFSSPIEQILPNGINDITTASCNLEKKQFSLGRGFNFADH
jgi:hypothetical protein